MNNFSFDLSDFERNGTAPVSFQARKNLSVAKNKKTTNTTAISSSKINSTKSSKIQQAERPKTSVNMDSDLSELNMSLRMNKLNSFSSETNLLDNEESNNKNRKNILFDQQFFLNKSNGNTKDRVTNNKEDFYVSNSWIETSNSDSNSNNSSNNNKETKKKEFSAYKQKIPELLAPKRPKSVKISSNSSSLGDKKNNGIIHDFNDTNRSKQAPLYRPTTTSSIQNNDKTNIRTSLSRSDNRNNIDRSFRKSVYGSIQTNPKKEIISTKSSSSSTNTNTTKVTEININNSQSSPLSPKSKTFTSKFTSKIKKERVPSPTTEQLFLNNNNNNKQKIETLSIPIVEKKSSFLISELNRSPTADFIQDSYDDDDDDIQNQFEKFISSPDKTENNILRPTSRKVYLDNDNKKKVENSIIEHPMTVINPKYNQSLSSAFINIDQEELHNDNINLRPSNSFNGFSTSTHWEQQEKNRPPTRQNSAFPVYLADPNHESDGDMDYDDFDIYEDDDDDIEYDGMQFEMDNKDGNEILENSNNRPPTQKNPAAQHLFDDRSDFIKNNTNDTSKSTSHLINKTSNLNINDNYNIGYNQKESALIKKQLSSASSSPNLKKTERSVSTSSLLSLESSQSNRIDRGDRTTMRRQYDPISDGFTDLGETSDILPFRIEINYSTSNINHKSSSFDSEDVEEEVLPSDIEIESPIKNPVVTTSIPSGQLLQSRSHANIMSPSTASPSLQSYRTNHRENSTSPRTISSSPRTVNSPHNPSPLLNSFIYNEPDPLSKVFEKPSLRRSLSENFSIGKSIVVDTSDFKDFSPLSSPSHSNKAKSFRNNIFNSIHSNDKPLSKPMIVISDSPVEESLISSHGLGSDDDEIDEDLLDSAVSKFNLFNYY
jgi:hypothetical protein